MAPLCAEVYNFKGKPSIKMMMLTVSRSTRYVLSTQDILFRWHLVPVELYQFLIAVDAESAHEVVGVGEESASVTAPPEK